MAVAQLVLGLALLIIGAEFLVSGAVRIAARLGISALVIGLTVVSFGTSTPELGVSLLSVSEGKAGLALGNVVGSNIFNVLFILGLSALITPLVVARQLVRLDVPVMIALSVAVLLLSWNGRLVWWEGGLLVLSGIGYIVWLVVQSRKEEQPAGREEKGAHSPKRLVVDIFLVLLGLGMLFLGARWLVDGAVAIATRLGVSDLVIGLTIIALGTSLPEVATSVLASFRGQKDIAVGNVVGSNLFNLFFILGISVFFSGRGIEIPASALQFDLPVMIAVAIACLPIFFTGYRLDRWEGFIFLGYYIAYSVYLYLYSQESEWISAFSAAMLFFFFPLTILTLLILVIRESAGKKPG